MCVHTCRCASLIAAPDTSIECMIGSETCNIKAPNVNHGPNPPSSDFPCVAVSHQAVSCGAHLALGLLDGGARDLDRVQNRDRHLLDTSSEDRMTTAGQPTSSQMLERFLKETDLVVGLLQEGARGLDTVHDRLRHLT